MICDIFTKLSKIINKLLNGIRVIDLKHNFMLKTPVLFQSSIVFCLCLIYQVIQKSLRLRLAAEKPSLQSWCPEILHPVGVYGSPGVISNVNLNS